MAHGRCPKHGWISVDVCPASCTVFFLLPMGSLASATRALCPAVLTEHAFCDALQDDAAASQRWQPPGTRPSGLAGRGAPAQDLAVTAAAPRAVAPPGASSVAQRSDGPPPRPVVELSMKIAGAGCCYQ